MADKVKDAAQEVPRPVRESTYSAKELADNSVKLFSVHRDIATAALSLAGVTDCTVTEARKIVTQFAERKVEK